MRAAIWILGLSCVGCFAARTPTDLVPQAQRDENVAVEQARKAEEAVERIGWPFVNQAGEVLAADELPLPDPYVQVALACKTFPLPAICEPAQP